MMKQNRLKMNAQWSKEIQYYYLEQGNNTIIKATTVTTNKAEAGDTEGFTKILSLPLSL